MAVNFNNNDGRQDIDWHWNRRFRLSRGNPRTFTEYLDEIRAVEHPGREDQSSRSRVSIDLTGWKMVMTIWS
jgi:hypothetical protein